MGTSASREPYKKVKIGDRVAWRASPKITGTVKEIYLTAHPFYVLWDKGTDDWYKGEDLVLLEPELKRDGWAMSDILVCRRVEDNPAVSLPLAECKVCRARVFVEGGVEQPEQKVCIHCAAKSHANLVLFVELPPDEYGHRSTAVTLQQVYEKDDGQWHKSGVWHNQKWVLARQE